MPARIQSPTIPTRPVPPGAPVSVTIKAGDSLSKIAQRAGVSMAAGVTKLSVVGIKSVVRE